MDHPWFDIDPDIARSRTLPSAAYTDGAVYRRQLEAVFARSWQFVGTTDDVKVPGARHPVELLPGSLGEPLLLTRDHDDRVHCLSNVCTHRGTVLCEHAGQGKAMTCRYHGRRFGLDGTCTFMPEFEGVEGFPAQSDHLPRVEFGTWGKFVFASLDPPGPLEDQIRAMRDRLSWFDLASLRFDPTRSREYLVGCHWALYCDNYLEGFHIPFVHASLNDTLDYGEYVTELHTGSSLQLGIGKGGEHCFDLPSDSPDAGKRVAAYYWWLFPNTMINVYPWGVSVNVVEPLGVDRTRVRFLSYVLDASLIAQGAGAAIDRVGREDEAIVESVQRGTSSRLYDRGRYSPTRETGVHHFHRMLAERLIEE